MKHPMLSKGLYGTSMWNIKEYIKKLVNLISCKGVYFISFVKSSVCITPKILLFCKFRRDVLYLSYNLVRSDKFLMQREKNKLKCL